MKHEELVGNVGASIRWPDSMEAQLGITIPTRRTSDFRSTYLLREYLNYFNNTPQWMINTLRALK